MNIYHKECAGRVKVDLTESAKLTSHVTISNKGELVPVTLSIKRVTNYVNLKFVCTTCSKDDFVEKGDWENLVFQCENCGGSGTKDEMKVPRDSGGVYCQKCSERFGTDESIGRLSTNINTEAKVYTG